METVHLLLDAGEYYGPDICLGKEGAGTLLTGDIALVDQAGRSLFGSNQLVVLSDFSQDCSLSRGAKRRIHLESCVKADKTSYRMTGFGRVLGNRRQCYVIWTPDRHSSSSACS